jgi:3-oxoacyl-[acyl-carrier protein] reductase
MQKLNGSTVLLSGTRGLALALGRSLLARGARLVVLARSEDSGSGFLAGCEPSHRDRVAFCFGDLAALKDREAWVRCAVERDGKIDAVVNNAAELGPAGPFGEVSIDAFRRTIEVNLVAPAHVIQLALPNLVEGGAVINLSGGGATAARPFFAAYGSAKCALVRLTETLAVEYPEFRFFAVAPGAMKTAMMEQIATLGADQIGEEFLSAKRVLEQGGASPEKVADLVVWLLEEADASWSGRLVSAVWDPYREMSKQLAEIPDWGRLRRVDRNLGQNLLKTLAGKQGG